MTTALNPASFRALLTASLFAIMPIADLPMIYAEQVAHSFDESVPGIIHTGHVINPTDAASIRVWVDPNATITINGKPTKRQTWTGEFAGSRDYTLTGFQPNEVKAVTFEIYFSDEQLPVECTWELTTGNAYCVTIPQPSSVSKRTSVLCMFQEAATPETSPAEPIPPPQDAAADQQASPKRSYKLEAGQGQLAARLVYDDRSNLSLREIQFDGKHLPEAMFFSDETDWKALGVENLVPIEGTLTLTLQYAMEGVDPAPIGEPYAITITLNDDRSADLKFNALVEDGEPVAKNIRTWIEQSIASNNDPENPNRLFLSDNITALRIAATFALGREEAVQVEKSVEIAIVK